MKRSYLRAFALVVIVATMAIGAYASYLLGVEHAKEEIRQTYDYGELVD